MAGGALGSDEGGRSVVHGDQSMVLQRSELSRRLPEKKKSIDSFFFGERKREPLGFFGRKENENP
ncbi:hypothetical protein RND71_031980 [Anisodus tanguticus]|uniref:Uncharacterized protein n=1 Tax=Anisodus tanguticus TaxID=243964 RepID=A0AAE1V699_9SOLA|nr:hypothetical protein RND71_031980 [Anisodus tanguticus]